MQDMTPVQNVQPIPLSFETKLNTVAPAPAPNPVLSKALFIACALAYFSSAVVISRKAGLWMDEVLASWMTQLPSAKMIWQAISHGTISSPPTYFDLLKAVTAIFGPSYPALRRPSIVVIYLTGIMAFLIMRRRFPAPIAVLGMALCFVTGLFGYATQVREYALVTACFAVAVFLWYPARGQMLAPWRIALEVQAQNNPPPAR